MTSKAETVDAEADSQAVESIHGFKTSKIVKPNFSKIKKLAIV